MDYGVEADHYTGGVIFRSSRIGAFFYVLPETWRRHTRLCEANGYRPTRRSGRRVKYNSRGKLVFNTTKSQVGGPMKFRNAVLSAAGVLVFSAACFAQTTSIEGDVIGADGKPMANTKCVVIDRKDIKGHYGPVKTDKKGHYFHAGLPIGQYKVSVIDDNGKVLDFRSITFAAAWAIRCR